MEYRDRVLLTFIAIMAFSIAGKIYYFICTQQLLTNSWYQNIVSLGDLNSQCDTLIKISAIGIIWFGFLMDPCLKLIKRIRKGKDEERWKSFASLCLSRFQAGLVRDEPLRFLVTRRIDMILLS